MLFTVDFEAESSSALIEGAASLLESTGISII
jgi:hypothetical protein